MVDFKKELEKKKGELFPKLDKRFKKIDIKYEKASPEPFKKTLNEEQSLAFDALQLFIETPTDEMFKFEGYAGTGKTYTITKFIEYCMALRRTDIKTDNPQKKGYGKPEIALTAPTNKAVQVLRESSDRGLIKQVSFDTIHALLGLKEQINDSGEVEFRNDSQSSFMMKIEDKQIVVIDESSMLQDDLFYEIKRYAPSKKIIFMGDPFQIPPVGKEDCEPFLNADKHNIIGFKLEKIMRQKNGSSIIDLSMYIRLTNNHEFQQFASDEVSVLSSENEKERIAALVNVVVRSKEFVDNPGLMKLISWRNSKVKQYNAYVRSIYFSYAYPKLNQNLRVLPNDRMITNQPYAIEVENKDFEIILTTNQEFTVKRYRISDECFKHIKGDATLRFYDCIVETYDSYEDKIVEKKVRILHEDSDKEFDSILLTLKNAAMYAPANKRGFFWREYYSFARTFCKCDYSYAITAHKSQGSTYDIAVVDSNDILLNQNHKESRRILYTAVTRAKNKLILIN